MNMGAAPMPDDRDEPFKQLARLGGTNGVERLLAALSDWELRDAALAELGSLAAREADQGVVNTLAKEIARDSAKDVSAFVGTFLARGGQAKNLAEQTTRQLEPGVAMAVHWRLNDIGPRQVAAKLQAACGGAEPSKETIEEVEERWRKDANAEGVLYSLIGGPWRRLTAIICKTVSLPADHDDLIHNLSGITGEHFTLDNVTQTVEPNGALRLQFTHQDAGYSFSVENHGRWLNLRGVLDELNAILARLDRAERFIALYSESCEVAVVLFVDAEKFLPVARELRIPLQERA